MSFVQFDFSVSSEHPWVGLDNFKGGLAGPDLAALPLGHARDRDPGCGHRAHARFLLALAMLRPFPGRRVLMVLFVIPLFISPVIVGGFFDLFLRRPFGPANWLLSGCWATPWRSTSRSTAVAVRRAARRGRMAVDAVHVRDPARGAGSDPRRSLRGDRDGWREAPAVVLLRDAAAPDADHPDRGHIPLHRRSEALRHHLLADPRRARHQTYTSSYYLYQQGFQFFHLGQGTAGAWMFTIMLTFISFWLVRRLLKPVEG